GRKTSPSRGGWAGRQEDWPRRRCWRACGGATSTTSKRWSSARRRFRVRRMRRVTGVLLAVLIACALPACGSKGGAKTDESKRAAGLVPADALAFVSVNASPSDAQKSHVASILEKLPK